tara:strand:+ start:86 stop:379 length:294 start_codon:yes stop_codon:yes gene_type:complete
MYVHEGSTNTRLDSLPIPVAKSILQERRTEREERHARERALLMQDMKRLEIRMKSSDAFTKDIIDRLGKIRSAIHRRKKSVRFAANVKRDSKHRVMR